MQSLTHIDTAHSMYQLFDAISKYEIERLTWLSEGDARKEDTLRQDRLAVYRYNRELTTSIKLIGHLYDNYVEHQENNVYLNFTPVALRQASGVVAMLRHAADLDAEQAMAWSDNAALDVDDQVWWRENATDVRSLEGLLWSHAEDIYLAQYRFDPRND